MCREMSVLTCLPIDMYLSGCIMVVSELTTNYHTWIWMQLSFEVNNYSIYASPASRPLAVKFTVTNNT